MPAGLPRWAVLQQGMLSSQIPSQDLLSGRLQFATIPEQTLANGQRDTAQVLPALHLFAEVLALGLSVLFLSDRCTHTQIH